MDLAQMLMFQQLGNAAPVKNAPPIPMAEEQENPIVKMMRGPAAEPVDGGALQLQKLQMSGAIPAPKMSAADEAQKNYVEANSRGLTQQRDALAELAKLVGENKPDVNPMQNLFTGLQDTVTGGNKLQTLMQIQQAGKDAFLKQNESLQKAREGYTDKENDLEKTKLTFAQAQDKAKADREQFKLLYGLKAQNADNSADNKISKQEQNLFSEWTKNAITKDSQNVATAYEKVSSAAKDPSAAGDLSLIFGYMKMLDPGSTVREGEFATAAQAAGVPDRILNQYNKIISGQRLAPNQRQDFVNQSEKVFKSQLAQQKRWDQTIGERAKAAGVNPENVMFGKKLFGDKYDQKEQSAKPTTIKQNGHTYTLNPQTGEYE